MITAVSLFAGVGGFDLALERAGVNVVASVEIDKNARNILTKQFPNATIFNDVKEVTGEQLIAAGFDPSTGVITGGFPCQDLSVAGKRAGLAGDRSGLFFEIARILEETKAKFFILENVPGLLSSNKGRDMGTVIGTLDELGYSVAWRVLDAQYFGVPQRRRRIFIVGCLGDDWRTPAQILSLIEGRTGYLEASQSKGKDAPRATPNGAGAFGQSGFAKYTEGVTTLTATSYKRPEDNVVVPFTASSFAQYQEGVGTLRSSGGDLGGGSETLLALSKLETIRE
jgi:DNA (cytosine-5)-methyltransferase 1